MNLQRTLKKEINCSSVGLHTGRKVNMRIKPAHVDTGIIFKRNDLPDAPPIRAEFNNVCDTTLATSLGTNGVTVATVEHILSAFSGMGVDNAIVELDSFEVPIMDGSALPFVNLLKEVGTHTQGKTKKLLLIKKPVSVTEKEGSAVLLPAEEFKITYQSAKQRKPDHCAGAWYLFGTCRHRADETSDCYGPVRDSCHCIFKPHYFNGPEYNPSQDQDHCAACGSCIPGYCCGSAP